MDGLGDEDDITITVSRCGIAPGSARLEVKNERIVYFRAYYGPDDAFDAVGLSR